MIEVAYGHMGLTPYELALLTPYQYNLKVKGYLGKQDLTESYFRRLAYINVCINSDPKSRRKPDLDTIWPTRHTKKATTQEMTQSKVQTMLELLKKKQNVN